MHFTTTGIRRLEAIRACVKQFKGKEAKGYLDLGAERWDQSLARLKLFVED